MNATFKQGDYIKVVYTGAPVWSRFWFNGVKFITVKSNDFYVTGIITELEHNKHGDVLSFSILVSSSSEPTLTEERIVLFLTKDVEQNEFEIKQLCMN